MGWLRSVGSIKSYVSFAEYCLFYRAVLQKRPIILSILLTVATPYRVAADDHAVETWSSDDFVEKIMGLFCKRALQKRRYSDNSSPWSSAGDDLSADKPTSWDLINCNMTKCDVVKCDMIKYKWRLCLSQFAGWSRHDQVTTLSKKLWVSFAKEAYKRDDILDLDMIKWRLCLTSWSQHTPPRRVSFFGLSVSKSLDKKTPPEKKKYNFFEKLALPPALQIETCQKAEPPGGEGRISDQSRRRNGDVIMRSCPKSRRRNLIELSQNALQSFSISKI